ncbi:MAG: hypothetical protein ACD_62C00066G0008 [uncultured bacterium]|nr:MAG: hypothetical protein ACD_62C00066G0008 [uncultured bacterium]
MNQTTSLSTVIDSQIKKAVVEFCRVHGLKIQFLIENALVEYLEDAVDLEAYQARKNEFTVSLAEVLSRSDAK